MKKLALSMIAALAIFSVSCSKSGSDNDSTTDKTEQAAKGDVKSQLISLCNKTAEAINANPADVDKIMADFNQKGEELSKNLTEAEQREFMNDENFQKAINAVFEAAMKATPSLESLGAEIEEDEEETIEIETPESAATLAQ